jgi:hypothetical protein
MCVFTVPSERCRSQAISAFACPCVMSVSTSRSRTVSTASGLASAGAGGAVPRKWVISRRVTLGAATDSPETTTRTAAIRSPASVSLGRNPLAPARSPA